MPRFQKRHPGGPGRPRGSRNAVNLLLDRLAVEGAEVVVKKMIEAAADGGRVERLEAQLRHLKAKLT